MIRPNTFLFSVGLYSGTYLNNAYSVLLVVPKQEFYVLSVVISNRISSVNSGTFVI